MLSLRRLRKVLISGFVVLAIVTQVLQNMAVGYIGARPELPYPAQLAAWWLDNLRWGTETFGFYTGTNTYWRMFSPVHRYDWSWRVMATEITGGERELASPSATGRTGIDAFFVDFRETKLLLNLWTRPPMQSAYIDHRCREESRSGRPVAAIRLELHWREIVRPAEAAATGTHRAPATYSRVMAQRECP